MLGANFIVEEGEDISEVVKRVAADRGTTYVFLGRPRGRHGLRRFSEPLPQRIVREVPGVDVRIVADRTLLPEAEH